MFLISHSEKNKPFNEQALCQQTLMRSESFPWFKSQNCIAVENCLEMSNHSSWKQGLRLIQTYNEVFLNGHSIYKVLGLSAEWMLQFLLVKKTKLSRKLVSHLHLGTHTRVLEWILTFCWTWCCLYGEGRLSWFSLLVMAPKCHPHEGTAALNVGQVQVATEILWQVHCP